MSTVALVLPASHGPIRIVSELECVIFHSLLIFVLLLLLCLSPLSSCFYTLIFPFSHPIVVSGLCSPYSTFHSLTIFFCVLLYFFHSPTGMFLSWQVNNIPPGTILSHQSKKVNSLFFVDQIIFPWVLVRGKIHYPAKKKSLGQSRPTWDVIDPLGQKRPLKGVRVESSFFL